MRILVLLMTIFSKASSVTVDTPRGPYYPPYYAIRAF